MMVNDSTNDYMQFVESAIFLYGDQTGMKNHKRDFFLNSKTDQNYQMRLVLSWA